MQIEKVYFQGYCEDLIGWFIWMWIVAWCFAQSRCLRKNNFPFFPLYCLPTSPFNKAKLAEIPPKVLRLPQTPLHPKGQSWRGMLRPIEYSAEAWGDPAQSWRLGSAILGVWPTADTLVPNLGGVWPAHMKPVCEIVFPSMTAGGELPHPWPTRYGKKLCL